jgi:hypothetical protein
LPTDKGLVTDMEEKKITLSLNSMNYGGMAGTILFLLFIVGGFLGKELSSLISVVGYIVLGITIYVGSSKYRDQVLNGSISYGTSFYSGVLISFFAGVLIAFAAFLYLKFVDSSILDSLMLEIEENIMKEYPDDDAKAEKAMEMMKVINNPLAFALIFVLSYTFWGAVLSLIISGFVKRNTPSSNSFDNFIQQNQ